MSRARRPPSLAGLRREHRLLAAVAAIALTVAWLLAAPGPRPPLYDGIGFPDEPYRYVTPPAGATAAKPTVADDTEPVVNQHAPTLFPTSLETGPQVQAYIPGAALSTPAGAKLITARVVPLAPAAPLPTDGTVWGNVYRLSITSDQGPVRVQSLAGSPLHLTLRAPVADPTQPAIEAFSAGVWRQLTTNREGNDIFGADIPGTGDYALVRLTHPPASKTTSAPPGLFATRMVLLSIVAAALLLLVAGIAAVRMSRRRPDQ